MNSLCLSPLLKSEEEKDEAEQHFLVTALVMFVIVCVVMLFWSNCIPFSLFEPWYFGTQGGVWEAIKASWGIFLWGGGVTLIGCLFTQNERHVNRDAEDIIVGGTLISIMAGVLEEIAFRWWIFFGEILVFKFFNLITCGLVAWLMYYVCCVANFFTLGWLEPQLFNAEWGWAVGAAIIGSNGKFRNGHAYLGTLGYVNSWFIGMFMFYLMFNYGLLAAIVVHFLYDQLIFTIRYLDAVKERSMGFA